MNSIICGQLSLWTVPQAARQGNGARQGMSEHGANVREKLATLQATARLSERNARTTRATFPCLVSPESMHAEDAVHYWLSVSTLPKSNA